MRLIMATGRGFSAWLIKTVTNSPFTHTAIQFDGTQEDVVLHSSTNGVELVSMDYIKGHYDDLVFYECNFAEAREAAVEMEKRWSGAKYDTLSFIGLGLAVIFGWKKNPLGKSKQLMCTEVIAEWLNFAHELNPKLEIPYINSEMLTPRGLANWVASRTDLFTKV